MTALRAFPVSARAAAIDSGRARRWNGDTLGIVPNHRNRAGRGRVVSAVDVVTQ